MSSITMNLCLCTQRMTSTGSFLGSLLTGQGERLCGADSPAREQAVLPSASVPGPGDSRQPTPGSLCHRHLGSHVPLQLPAEALPSSHTCLLQLRILFSLWVCFLFLKII